MVKKAVAYYKAKGKDAAFAEINNPKGQFTDRDLYVVVYDTNGKVLAHGANAKMIGKDTTDIDAVQAEAVEREVQGFVFSNSSKDVQVGDDSAALQLDVEGTLARGVVMWFTELEGDSAGTV